MEAVWGLWAIISTVLLQRCIDAILLLETNELLDQKQSVEEILQKPKGKT